MSHQAAAVSNQGNLNFTYEVAALAPINEWSLGPEGPLCVNVLNGWFLEIHVGTMVVLLIRGLRLWAEGLTLNISG